MNDDVEVKFPRLFDTVGKDFARRGLEKEGAQRHVMSILSWDMENRDRVLDLYSSRCICLVGNLIRIQCSLDSILSSGVEVAGRVH